MSMSLDFRSPSVPPVVGSLAVRVAVDSRYARFLPKLHAVVGGFHLGMVSPEYIQHSVDELAALSPDVIVPMHCTGAAFIERMRSRMPDRVVASNLGSRFTFGA